MRFKCAKTRTADSSTRRQSRRKSLHCKGFSASRASAISLRNRCRMLKGARLSFATGARFSRDAWHTAAIVAPYLARRERYCGFDKDGT